MALAVHLIAGFVGAHESRNLDAQAGAKGERRMIWTIVCFAFFIVVVLMASAFCKAAARYVKGRGEE